MCSVALSLELSDTIELPHKEETVTTDCVASADERRTEDADDCASVGHRNASDTSTTAGDDSDQECRDIGGYHDTPASATADLDRRCSHAVVGDRNRPEPAVGACAQKDESDLNASVSEVDQPEPAVGACTQTCDIGGDLLHVKVDVDPLLGPCLIIGSNTDALVEYVDLDDEWKKLYHHKVHRHVLESWSRSTGASGNAAWYMAELFKKGGEYSFEARISTQQQVSEKWSISFPGDCSKDISMTPLKVMYILSSLEIEGDDATISLSTLTETLELQSPCDSTWANVLCSVLASRGEADSGLAPTCSLRDASGNALPPGETLAAAALRMQALSKAGGA